MAGVLIIHAQSNCCSTIPGTVEEVELCACNSKDLLAPRITSRCAYASGKNSQEKEGKVIQAGLYEIARSKSVSRAEGGRRLQGAGYALLTRTDDAGGNENVGGDQYRCRRRIGRAAKQQVRWRRRNFWRILDISIATMDEGYAPRGSGLGT